MKNRKGMKEMASKGLLRCIHACARSVNEIKPGQSMSLLHLHALHALHGNFWTEALRIKCILLDGLP